MELTACHVTGRDVTSTDRRKRSLHLRDVYQEGQVSCLGLRGAPILETSRNKVLASKRMRDGKKRYYIKWEDYDESENSWVREENLKCPELLAEYEDEKKKQHF